NGRELWTSDGTGAGTYRLVSFQAFQGDLTDVNGTAFFVADGGIWKSDGTPVGTVLVKQVGASNLTASGGVLYFAGSDGAHGLELWKSDGTSGGTGVLTDVNPGPGYSYPLNMADVNGTLFFAATDGTAYGLYKT